MNTPIGLGAVASPRPNERREWSDRASWRTSTLGKLGWHWSWAKIAQDRARLGDLEIRVSQMEASQPKTALSESGYSLKVVNVGGMATFEAKLFVLEAQYSPHWQSSY